MPPAMGRRLTGSRDKCREFRCACRSFSPAFRSSGRVRDTHNPALATTVRGILGPPRAGWVKAAQRMPDDGRLPPGTDVDAAGAVLFALLPGFLLQHLILGDTDAATLQRGLRQLLRPELLSAG